MCRQFLSLNFVSILCRHFLSAFLLFLVSIKFGRCQDNREFIQICNGTSGQLSVSPKSSYILTIDDAVTNMKTVFLNYRNDFTFECNLATSDEYVTPRIEFKSDLDRLTRVAYTYSLNKTRNESHEASTSRTLNSSYLHSNNLTNFTAECNVKIQVDSGTVQKDNCKVNIVIVNPVSTNCSVGQFIYCQAEDILDKLNLLSRPLTIIQFSVFVSENQSWVQCKETIKRITTRNSGSTKFIMCPVPMNETKEPFMIRVEEMQKTDDFIANDRTSNLTFYSVYISQTFVYEEDDEILLASNEISIGIYAGIGLGLLFIIAFGTCFILKFAHPKDPPTEVNDQTEQGI